jgi:hypothetical protein
MNTNDLKSTDIGQLVIYDNGCDPHEEGVITSWNDTYIFVRYGSDIHSKATKPEHLRFTN